jgi:hypothetical protein
MTANIEMEPTPPTVPATMWRSTNGSSDPETGFWEADGLNRVRGGKSCADSPVTDPQLCRDLP